MKLFAILAVVAASLTLTACSTCKSKAPSYSAVQPARVQPPATHKTVEK
jgi:predicted component of type VI protein secretion system